MVKPPYNPYQFIDGTNPNINVGRFEYFEGSLKAAINAGLNGEESPFVDIVLGGTRSFQNDDNTLKLKDSDKWGTKSGWVSLKMASNYQGFFYLITENNDYFGDNYVEGIEGIFTSTNEIADELEGNWPTVWVQEDYAGTSITMFGLDSGDYISVDLDSLSDRAAQMRVRIGGVDYFDNSEIDADTWLSKLWIRKWNPDYVSALTQDEIDELEGGGGVYIPPPITPTVCPIGQAPNEFGICVPIEAPPTPPTPPQPPTPPEEISGGAMVLVLALVVGSIIVAVRVA